MLVSSDLKPVIVLVVARSDLIWENQQLESAQDQVSENTLLNAEVLRARGNSSTTATDTTTKMCLH